MKNAFKMDIQDVLNKVASVPDYAHMSLAQLIDAHSEAVARHDATEDDTPEMEAAYNDFLALEVAVSEYPARNHRELAIKARFVFEYCQMANYTGTATVSTAGLDHAQAAAFLTLRDIERMAQTPPANGFLDLENDIWDLARYARLTNRMICNAPDEDEKDEIDMLAGVMDTKAAQLKAAFIAAQELFFKGAK